MLPVTNSYRFRESYLSKFCFLIICEERKPKVFILNSTEKFVIFLANICRVRFSMVNSKHRYCRCLLIKIYRPYPIVFTFHENLSDEKLPEMKRTFLFFWNLKPLVTCNKMNHKFALSFVSIIFVHWCVTRHSHFPLSRNLTWKVYGLLSKSQKSDLLNALLLNEKQTDERFQIFMSFNNINISPASG